MTKAKQWNSRDWVLGIIGTILSAMVLATYVKVGKIDVHEAQINNINSRIDDQDRRMDRIEGAIYMPAWKDNSQKHKDAMRKEYKDSKFLFEYTCENLLSSRDLLAEVDQFLILNPSYEN